MAVRQSSKKFWSRSCISAAWREQPTSLLEPLDIQTFLSLPLAWWTTSNRHGLHGTWGMGNDVWRGQKEGSVVSTGLFVLFCWIQDLSACSDHCRAMGCRIRGGGKGDSGRRPPGPDYVGHRRMWMTFGENKKRDRFMTHWLLVLSCGSLCVAVGGLW